LQSEAIVKVNANLLEITQWSFKLTSAGVPGSKIGFPPQKMQHHLLTQHIPNTYLGCGPCLRAAVVATAFVSQMESEEKNLRSAKQALETALSLGQPLKDVTQKLEDANSQYRTASVQIRKHATPPSQRWLRGRQRRRLQPLQMALLSFA
jgi:hypothetical protein